MKIAEGYRIRPIESRDDATVERIIRTCLTEYGANHEGTAWADPDLGRFSEIYSTDGNAYWVVETDGVVVGGVGIGELTGADGVCELQKMYILREHRGRGLASALLEVAIEYARRYYTSCYLETLDNMVEAQRFYENHGFVRVDDPIVDTGHFACDVRYMRSI